MLTNEKSIDTQIYRIEPENPDLMQIRKAAEILKTGGLLAFPTETVYGLGADATDSSAAKRIYAAKGRPSDNPLIVHIADMDTLRELTVGNLDRAKRLAKVFWPGPLTMILKKSDVIPFETTGGLDTVAIRFPSRTVANLIIKECGLPIAAPSANISGRPSPTRAAHVIEDFNGRIEGIVDDGPSPIGVESTIVDISGETPVLLRRGYIQKSELEEVLGESVLDTFGSPDPDKPRAPGMKYRHYAPKGELYIIDKSFDFAALEGQIQKALSTGKRIGLIASKECLLALPEYDASDVKTYCIGSRTDGKTIMQNLYAILRMLDDDGIETAYAEDFSDVLYGETIMERLLRASGGKVLKP